MKLQCTPCTGSYHYNCHQHNANIFNSIFFISISLTKHIFQDLLFYNVFVRRIILLTIKIVKNNALNSLFSRCLISVYFYSLTYTHGQMKDLPSGRITWRHFLNKSQKKRYGLSLKNAFRTRWVDHDCISVSALYSLVN